MRYLKEQILALKKGKKLLFSGIEPGISFTVSSLIVPLTAAPEPDMRYESEAHHSLSYSYTCEYGCVHLNSDTQFSSRVKVLPRWYTLIL